MTRPPYARQSRTNETRIVKADERAEDPAGVEHLCAPASLVNISRVEALRYAWKADYFLRLFLLAIGILNAVSSIALLVAEPWEKAIPPVLELIGELGIYPALVGAAWLLHGRWKPSRNAAYQARAALPLLAAGAGLVAVGLLGAWLRWLG